MGSRKRPAKSQPIRKRKKTKQVLAKVAERKEDRQEKLERKLAEADTRINAARLSALAIPSTPTPSNSAIPNSDVFPVHYPTSGKEQYNDDNDDLTDDDDQSDEHDNAYGMLVNHLTKPLHNSTVSLPILSRRERPVTSKNTEEENSSKTSDSAKQKNAEPRQESSAQAQEFIDATFKNAEFENRIAAARENRHFSFKIDPKLNSNQPTTSSSSSYSPIAEWPHLKISAASVPAEAFETITKQAKDSSQPVSLGVQPTTLRRWQQHPTFERVIGGQKSSPLLRSIASTIRGFHDLLMCANTDPLTEDAIRSLYVAHCVSHVLRCRSRVMRNNVMVNEDAEGEGDDSFETNIPDEAVLRDRGFVRARVLIIVPMRSVAYDVINQIILLTGGGPLDSDNAEKGSSKVLLRDRFEREFGYDEDEDENEVDVKELKDEFKGDDSGILRAGVGIRTKTKNAADHSRTFRGNVDDDFKLGISLTKKAIKLFSDFYDSDFIIASPLGLRRSHAAKASGQDKHSRLMREKKKKEEDTEWQSGIDSKVERRVKEENDNGFLSSIEICVIDGANILSMQNWDSLQRTMSMVNNMPKNTRDTDFSRVREYFLDGLMSQFRQSIVLSQYRKSEVMALFRTFNNHAGKVQVVEVPQSYGSMKEVAVNMVRQSFFRVPGVVSLSNANEERMKFFFDQTLPAVRAISDSQALVVVPSYFDFVRVRNKMVAMEEEDGTFRFSSMCEYSRAKDVVRARSRLYDRSIRIVIMTERFHFFYRHWIRGANTIVWFGLPENPQFYPEIINMTEEAAEKGQLVQSLALYDKFDNFILQRIVGSVRSRRMTSKQSRSTYLFV